MSTKRPTLTQLLEEAREQVAVERRQRQLTLDTLAACSEAISRTETIVAEAQKMHETLSARTREIAKENAELRESNLQLRRENDRLRMRRGPVGAFWDFVMGPPRA